MAITDIDPEKLLDENIFELLGVADAPQEQKNRVMSDISRTIENRVVARILDSLKDEEIAQFEKVLDEGDEATKTFLTARNIDAAKLAVEEAITYKAELLAMVEVADESKKDTSTNV